MYKEFVLSLVKEVAEINKKYFRNVGVDLKKDGSVVTKADIEINSLVIKRVKEHFPEHDIYGEEESSLNNNSDFIWVCDPIDGTFPFSIGVPTSIFSLALTKSGEPVVACAYDSHTGDFFYAEKGKGAFCNNKLISVNNKDLVTAGVTYWNKALYDISNTYPALFQEGVACYDFGSIVYMGMLVATGKIEAIVFPHTTAHDVAAIKLIVEEAGGICSDMFGKPQQYHEKINGFVASNKQVHERLLKTLAETMVVRT